MVNAVAIQAEPAPPQVRVLARDAAMHAFFTSLVQSGRTVRVAYYERRDTEPQVECVAEGNHYMIKNLNPLKRREFTGKVAVAGHMMAVMKNLGPFIAYSSIIDAETVD